MGTYVITGGATGIGAAIKIQLLGSGHEVIVVDIQSADIEADLSTAEGREKAIEAIHQKAPHGLDGFIPCAGVGPHVKPHALISKINYFGAVATLQGVKPLLVKKQGTVVIISSNSASMAGIDQHYVDCLLADEEQQASDYINGLDGHTAYAGSKQALTRWMRRQTVSWAAEGVRINAVAPGITKTALTDNVMADPEFGQVMKDFGKSVPIGRIGQPEQIAEVVCFLLSERAAFCCGAVFFVDGGHDAMLRPDSF